MQYILGKIFNIFLIILKKIFKCQSEYFTITYLILLSEITRNDKKYNIVYNFHHKYVKNKILNKIIILIISVLWIVIIDCVIFFKDLFLFIHNWSINHSNLFILITSEFLALNNIIEIIILIKNFNNGNMLKTKSIMMIIKPCIGILSYIIIIPLLKYIKKYYDRVINRPLFF
jgi:hypothetical protein